MASDPDEIYSDPDYRGWISGSLYERELFINILKTGHSLVTHEENVALLEIHTQVILSRICCVSDPAGIETATSIVKDIKSSALRRGQEPRVN